MVTGEQPLLGDNAFAGAMRRTITLKWNTHICQDDNEKINALVNGIKQNYGYAGRAFVEKLKQPDVMHHMKTRYEQHVKDLNASIHSAQDQAGAVILTADELAEWLIFQDGLRLSVDDIAPYLKDDDTISVGSRAQEAVELFLLRSDAAFSRTL